MKTGRLAQLGLLTLEAVRDAIRRRVVAAIAVCSLLSLWFVDGCTSCTGAGTLVVEGVDVSNAAAILGITGGLMFSILALWVVVLAGVLACDHLTQSLEDGSATLALARPVSRFVFALSRLLGSLVVSVSMGVILLGGAALLANDRYALPLPPAAAAGLACALGSVAVASLAMWSSLILPRVASYLLVFASVAVVAGVNLASSIGRPPTGVLGLIDRFGPPLGSALAVSLAPWIGRPAEAAEVADVALRLLAWAALGVGLLAVGFKRMELRPRAAS